MQGLSKVFSCRYCPRTGIGNVAFDPTAAMRLAHAKRGVMQVKVAGADPHGILIFDPDGSGRGPCPHVISMLIDVEVGPRRYIAGRRLTYVCNFDRPEFAQEPLGEALSEHLWLDINGGYDPAFHPTTPFSIGFPSRTLRTSTRSRWQIRVSGTVFVAMKPDTFMDELRETFLAGRNSTRGRLNDYRRG